MPRQKFCSVPGCLSTTELIKREQESFLSAFCERCCIGRPCRCPAPDIYTTRKETRTKFTSWCSAIGLKDPGYYINVCYKHFSTGCPSRSCPNPDVVIPVWEKHVRDKINNVLKPPTPSSLKKKKPPGESSGRKRKMSKTLIISSSSLEGPSAASSLSSTWSPLELHKLLLQEGGSSAPPDYSLLVQEECTTELSRSSSSSSSTFKSSEPEYSLGSPPLQALLDQSEDPCLNEGNILRAGGGTALPSSFSSYTNFSSFGDEFESVQKWLEICD